MNGPVSLLQHKLVGAADNDGACLAGCRHSGDLDTLAGAGLDLLHQLGGSKVLGCKVIKRGDGAAPDSFAEELNVFSLNILEMDISHVNYGKEVDGC